MQKKAIKCSAIGMAAFLLLTFASCDKGESIPVESKSTHTVDYSTPFTEVLTVAKNYYSVGEVNGRVYTTMDHLFSKTHCKVMLTKYSERNISIFSLSETDAEYVLTVQRIKGKSIPTKVEDQISTADPGELTKWIIEATLEGYDVFICYDKDSGRWNGYIIKD